MDKATQLSLLKIDLQISTDKLDAFLYVMLDGAAAAIARENIKLTDSIEDGMLIIQYAAYLYRKRREQNTAMPRYLRWMLNNRKISGEAQNNG